MNVHSHMGIEPGPKVPDAFYRFNEGVTNNNRFNRCFFKLLNWWVSIVRNSVFASFIIKRLAISQERTSAMHISIAETALISEWIEQGRKER